jgi:Ca2+-binding RTX toxin-like protein
MWMILGLFGALVAGAAADTMLTMRSSADQDEEADTVEQDDAELDDETSGDILTYFSDPLPQPLDPVGPEMHDYLPERVHSSDAYPEPAAAEPVVAVGGDIPSLLNGAALNDWLTGGSAETYLAGHGGDDLLRASTGPTHQIGGQGNDVLIGGSGIDWLEGGEGDDTLIAGAGTGTLLGGAGNDILVGTGPGSVPSDVAGPSFLNGGAGDDILIAGNGDYLNGGTGADTFLVAAGPLTGGAVTIVDYHSDEDQILLHFDPTRVPDPDVEIRFSAASPETAQIWLNGQMIAEVAQAPNLTVADIGLVPLTGPGLAGLAA